jgi:hypothetical protein
MSGEKSVRLFLLGDNKDAKAKIAEIDAEADRLKAENPELSIGIDTAAAAERIKVLRTAIADAHKDAESPLVFTTDDMQAIQNLDMLKARIDELAAIRKTITFDAEDKDAVAKIASLDLRLDELGRKTVDPKVGVSGMPKALAEIASLDLALDGLRAKEEKPASGGGLLGGLASLVSKIPLVGQLGGDLSNVGEEGASAGQALGSIASSGIGLGVVAVAVGAIATEAGGLATGLSAAGLGLGAFAVLALPTFKTILGNVGDTRKQLSKLPGDLQYAVGAVKSVKSEFSGMSKALQPQVIQLFSQALGIVSDNMGVLLPLARSVFGGISGSLAMVDRALQGPMFKGFIKQMESLSGPVLKAVVSGLIGVAGDMAGLMRTFSKKDVLESIAVAFRLVGAAISILTGIIKIAMGTFDFLTEVIRVNGHEFDVIGVTVGRVSRNIYDAVTGHIGSVVSFFRGLPGRIVSALGNLGGLLLSAGASIITGLITGIENAVPGLHSALSWVTHLIPSWKGPESVDRNLLYNSGHLIIGGLTRGLADATTSDLHAQLTRTTNVIANTQIPARMGAAASAGNGGIKVDLDWGPGADQDIISAFKKAIRVRGGNPAVLGR